MSRFLVFDTEDAALATERNIFARGAALAQRLGYELNADGDILGIKDGEPDPNGLTTAWDIPRQRADGRWVLLHPELHPAAENTAWLASVMAGIDAPIEDESEDWWQLERTRS